MQSSNLPARLLNDGYLTIPARAGGTGDFWYVTVLFLPLIGYLTYLGLEEIDVFLTPFMLVMAGILAWVYVALFGTTLRFILRRRRGWPGLHIDENGVYGSTLNVRGGRLDWSDVQAVDYQTSANSVYGGVAFAVGDRVAAGKGVRFRREVDLLVEMLPVDTYVLVPLLQAAYERWAPEEASPLLVDGRPIGLTNDNTTLQDTRLAAIQRGEAVTIDYGSGRMRGQLFFGVPFLIIFIFALLAFPAWMYTDMNMDSDEAWAFWISAPLFLLIALLMGVILLSIVQRYKSARSGKPLYILDAQGLHDPSGITLGKPLPWSACQLAYLRRQSRAPDMVMLKCTDLDRYLRSDRTLNKVTEKLKSWFQRDSLTIEYQLAKMRPDEMCDLLNEAIFRYGNR